MQFDREKTANILKAHGIIPTQQRVEIGTRGPQDVFINDTLYDQVWIELDPDFDLAKHLCQASEFGRRLSKTLFLGEKK